MGPGGERARVDEPPPGALLRSDHRTPLRLRGAAPAGRPADHLPGLSPAGAGCGRDRFHRRTVLGDLYGLTCERTARPEPVWFLTHAPGGGVRLSGIPGLLRRAELLLRTIGGPSRSGAAHRRGCAGRTRPANEHPWTGAVRSGAPATRLAAGLDVGP